MSRSGLINQIVFVVIFWCVFEMLVLDTTHTQNGQEIHKRKRSYHQMQRNKDHISKNLVKSVSDGRGALFATENSSVVFAQRGGTATLPCVVRKFSNGVVSWIRKQESSPTILTVGLTSHIADERFLVEHTRHLQNWGLIIKHITPSDAGFYECQVSTHPPTSIFIELRVTEASAEIMGAPDLHIKAGSPLILLCKLLRSTEKPTYVFWYHEQRMINHDQGVTVVLNKDSSVLRLEEADTSHSGNYTCSPSNAIASSINVHVLNATEEENPAAMMHANSSSVSAALFISILLTVTINLFILPNS